MINPGPQIIEQTNKMMTIEQTSKMMTIKHTSKKMTTHILEDGRKEEMVVTYRLHAECLLLRDMMTGGLHLEIMQRNPALKTSR